MARDGNGNFSLPYPDFVSGTTIVSSEVDSNNSDIATALTQSVAVDGQSVITGDLPMATFKFTGLGAGSAAGHSVRYEQVLLLAGGSITGPVGYTSADLTLSSGAATGTASRHNIKAESGTEDDLDTLTATNYADGDIVYLHADTGDTIYVTTAGNFAQPCLLDESHDTAFIYDGTNSKFEALAHGWVKLDSQSPSAATEADFTKGIGTAYDVYAAVFTDLITTTDGSDLYARMYDATLAAWQADASDYRHSSVVLDDSAGDYAAQSKTVTLSTAIVVAEGVSDTAGDGINGIMYLTNPGTAAGNKLSWNDLSYMNSAGSIAMVNGVGRYVAAANAVSGLRILPSADNITGKIELYGLRK